MGSLWIGNIRPMTVEKAVAEAIFVKDGFIQDVGSEKELRKKHKEAIDRTVDVRPYTLFPGFVDSHMHLIATGLYLSRLDLSAARTSGEMRAQIAHQAADTAPGDWVIGEGWNENDFPDRKIFHRRELDAIAPHHPVALTRVCRHAILANSLALAEAGIDYQTPDPPGGLIVRDDDGQPTGLLHDQARFLLMDVMPEITEAGLITACKKAIDHFYTLGLTGSHTEDLSGYGGFGRTFSVFRNVLDGGSRRFRTHLLVHHEVVDDMVAGGIRSESSFGDITMGAMKIFADGVLGSRTALLRHPYNDAPDTSGIAIQTTEELNGLVQKARGYGMAVAIHAIGDGALEAAVTAMEAFPNHSKLPDRLIHGQLVPSDLRFRIKKLPVIIDIQPSFVPSDFPWVVERLGEERIGDAYAWKTLIDDGIICAGGSDAPIEYANPILGIYAAVARKKLGDSHNGFFPGQKLSVFEAIRLYTHGSACAVSEEGSSGMIRPGYRADFTILDRDLLTTDIEAIPNTRPMMTVIDDHIVFQKE